MGFGYTMELDDTGDIVFDSASQRHTYVSDAKALAQDLKQRLLTEQGVHPIHPSVGLPFTDLLAAKFNEDLWRGEIDLQVRADARVATVTFITLTPDFRTRVAEVNIEAVAVDGTAFDISTLIGVRT